MYLWIRMCDFAAREHAICELPRNTTVVTKTHGLCENIVYLYEYMSSMMNNNNK